MDRPRRQRRAPSAFIECANEADLVALDATNAVTETSRVIVRDISALHKVWENDASCGICLDKIFERGVMYECRRHAYCYRCIYMWVRDMNPSCPQCKSLVSKIAACKTEAEMDTVNWSKLGVIGMTDTVSRCLTVEEIAYLEEMRAHAADGDFSDESTASETETFSEDNEDESDSSESSRSPHSYFDGNLSREQTFDGRAAVVRPRRSCRLMLDVENAQFPDEEEEQAAAGGEDEDDGDDDYVASDSEADGEEIAFSLVPGEEDLHLTRPRERDDADDDYEPDAPRLKRAKK